MPSPRTCSHVKINGVKCGSPALKYHTHCYFHYQWLHRRTHPYHYDRKEGWTTMTLPPLESKASILFAICEIQQSLLDGSIDFRTAKALFYGIQLAIQLRATDEIDAQETPDTCHELTEELEKARWRHERPPQVVCDSCTRADACLDATNCHHTTEQIRELERLHEPERYARQLKDEEYEKEQQRKNQELWDKKIAEDKAYNEERARKLALNSASVELNLGAPRLPQSANVGSTTPSLSTTPAAITPTLNPCHGERSVAVSRAAEPPFVSPTQAPAPTSTTADTTAFASACHHERSEGSASSPTTTNPNPNTPPSIAATARRQISDRKLFHSPAHFARLESCALNEINILRSNS